MLRELFFFDEFQINLQISSLLLTLTQRIPNHSLPHFHNLALQQCPINLHFLMKINKPPTHAHIAQNKPIIRINLHLINYPYCIIIGIFLHNLTIRLIKITPVWDIEHYAMDIGAGAEEILKGGKGVMQGLV